MPLISRVTCSRVTCCSAKTLTDIHWSDGLDEQSFLDTYWQQQALLIRQAFPDFTTPITPDELAGLSLEDGTTPRLIYAKPMAAMHSNMGRSMRLDLAH